MPRRSTASAGRARSDGVTYEVPVWLHVSYHAAWTSAARAARADGEGRSATTAGITAGTGTGTGTGTGREAHYLLDADRCVSAARWKLIGDGTFEPLALETMRSGLVLAASSAPPPSSRLHLPHELQLRDRGRDEAGLAVTHASLPRPASVTFAAVPPPTSSTASTSGTSASREQKERRARRRAARKQNDGRSRCVACGHTLKSLNARCRSCGACDGVLVPNAGAAAAAVAGPYDTRDLQTFNPNVWGVSAERGRRKEVSDAAGGDAGGSSSNIAARGGSGASPSLQRRNSVERVGRISRPYSFMYLPLHFVRILLTI